MRPIFMPSLLNGLTGDPGLWVDLFDENRAVLLDLGDLGTMSTRKLLRVERTVVSHTHMDHFIGFDRLLRLLLGREKELVVTGPAGFLDAVQGRMNAYCWNLIADYPVCIVAEEIDGETIRSIRFTGKGGMQPEALSDRRWDGTMHAERLFTMHGAVLDHGIPVLGTSLRETEHLSVNKDHLMKAGLVPGPWLRDLKHAVRRCMPADMEIPAELASGETKKYRLDDLVGEIIIKSPGQRIAYITDMSYTPDNIGKVVDLARNSDVMVCECAFLEGHRRLAHSRGHLTAAEAGEIARLAGAGRLAPFHLSPRYKGRENEVLREAAEAFGGPILLLSPTEISN